MPIYSLEAIKILSKTGGVQLANQRARRNALELGWDQKMLGAYVRALEARHFQKTLSDVSVFDGRVRMDVDAYRMRFDEERLCETNEQDACVFYMKLGIRKLSDTELIAIATFHLDGQP